MDHSVYIGYLLSIIVFNTNSKSDSQTNCGPDQPVVIIICSVAQYAGKSVQNYFLEKQTEYIQGHNVKLNV